MHSMGHSVYWFRDVQKSNVGIELIVTCGMQYHRDKFSWFQEAKVLVINDVYLTQRLHLIRVPISYAMNRSFVISIELFGSCKTPHFPL